MDRRGFLGKLVKGVAVATVAPLAIASTIEAAPEWAKAYGYVKTKPCEYMSFRINGVTYHVKKWAHDAMIRHKADRELAILGWAIPKPDGTIHYKNFKT